MKTHSIPSVLIVEDMFLLYQPLKTFLEKKGYHILEPEEEGDFVNSYEKAVSVASKTPPDIAILDIHLGQKTGKDGIDVANWLKKKYPIPIIILSGHGNEVNMRRLVDSHLFSFVSRDGSTGLYLEQLAQTMMLELARTKEEIQSAGQKVVSRLPVKEIKLEKSPFNKTGEVGKHDPVVIERLIDWAGIAFVSSARSINESLKNSVWIHQKEGNREFIHRGTLQDIEKLLPPYFCRINNSQIINLKMITGVRNNIYYQEELDFELSKNYEKEALPKIQLYCGLD
jgi:DNA-binding LytR/AlgR family response regulator